MMHAFDAWVHTVGPLAYLALGLAACIEYLFPPFPGDLIVVIGGVYAVRTDDPWPWVLAAVTLGSLVGAALNFAFGRWLSKRLHRWPAGKRFLGVTREGLERVEARMRRHGLWLVAANRFLPGVRALIFVAAGVSGMSLARVLGFGLVSALAWNIGLLSVGIAVGGNAERISALLGAYNRAAVLLVLLVVVGAAMVALLKNRRTPS